MRVIKFFFILICIVCFLSCATRTGSVAKKELPYVNLTESTKFVLLPTEGIEQYMDMVQFLSADFRGQNYFFNAWVKADENAIDMIFFNEMGASLGELSYKDSVVDFSSNVIPGIAIRFFKPEYIIADFQLCFYDPLLLNKSLKDSGLVLEIIDDGSRRIFNGNDVIIEIKKTENTVELINHLHGYAYTMEGDFHE